MLDASLPDPHFHHHPMLQYTLRPCCAVYIITTCLSCTTNTVTILSLPYTHYIFGTESSFTEIVIVLCHYSKFSVISIEATVEESVY